MATEVTVPPPAVWAQRNDVVFLTFNIETKDPEFKFTEDSLTFKAIGLPEKKHYDVTFNFFDKINPEKIDSKNCGRCFEFKIPKADSTKSYWPSLTNDKKKPHWLKVDFSKWRDETNDSDDELGGMGGMGGMPGMGGMGGMMGGMPGMGMGMGDGNLDNLIQKVGNLGGSDKDSKPTFDDLSDEEEDSDDAEIPNLE